MRLVDGKPIVDGKPNKHYIGKEKVWEYNITDHKYLKQMLLEQVAMGLIEVDCYRHKKRARISPDSLCSRYLSSRAVARQVLSAYMSLTSVFGMGTGGPS